jgi:hypothetical protein
MKNRSICVSGAVLGTLLMALSSAAQNSYMPLGSVGAVSVGPCPSNRNFTGSVCNTTTITACPNVADISLIFATYPPTNGRMLGTIVLFSGFGGGNATEPPGDEDPYVTSYTGLGYQVLQTATTAVNDSPPQGDLFFQQISKSGLSLALTENAIIACPTNEDVNDGIDAANAAMGQTGFQAVLSDMTTGTAACTKNH